MTAIPSYLASFEKIRGGMPSPLAALRERAIAGFTASGFPTTRDEDWKYTSVAPLAAQPFPLAEPAPLDDAADAVLHGAALADAACTLVFVNGGFSPAHSRRSDLPAGVLVIDLASAVRDHFALLEGFLATCLPPESGAFAALNTAFLRDGAFVYVPRDVRVEAPIHLVFANRGCATPAVAHPRTLIVAAAGGDATVIEQHIGLDGGSYWSNAVTEIALGRGSRIAHYKLQDEARDAFHIGATAARQGADSHFRSHAVSLGARLARNDVTTRFEQSGGSCALDGLYLLDGERHADQHTAIDHAVPRCSSEQLYKGILGDRGRAVFNGKVIVRPDAQHTDARQMNKNLLLSPDAEVDTKPQLEIFADDVKCSHGATIGRLDEESLFYLRARGIDAAAARDLLTFAFANELVERVAVASWRDRLAGLIRERFAAAPQGRSS